MVYPLGARPSSRRYHSLQLVPAPLLLTPESAVTNAGITDCDGGIGSSCCAAATTPQRTTHKRDFTNSNRMLSSFHSCTVFATPMASNNQVLAAIDETDGSPAESPDCISASSRRKFPRFVAYA